MKKIVVKEKKLRREKADGMQIGNEILIDPRLGSKEYADTVIHESLHIALPDLSEKEVCRVAGVITRVLWQEGYRKVQL